VVDEVPTGMDTAFAELCASNGRTLILPELVLEALQL
jgi:hypothetical protein